jgi:hypothetical protein
MTNLQRSLMTGVLNFTIAPLIMSISAQAMGVHAGATFVVAYAMFWPAFLANAGLQIEIHSSEWSERRQRFKTPLLFAEIAFLPLIVSLMLWLNPSVALFLQDATGWILGAAVAGGTNQTIDGFRIVWVEAMKEKHSATEESNQAQ